MHILLINLAAPQENDLVRNTAEAKKTKLRIAPTAAAAAAAGGDELDQENVRTEHPYELVKEHLGGRLPANDERLKNLQSRCAWADKILIATHGSRKPETCFIDLPDPAGRQELMDATTLGEFILKCLTEDARPYRLVLVMCWGARGIPTDLDYNQVLGEANLKSSFAFKFFTSICTKRQIRLSAWTGMLNFDAATGHSVIEDESSLEARRNQKRLAVDTKREASATAYKQRKVTGSAALLEGRLKPALKEVGETGRPNETVFSLSDYPSPEERVIAEEYQWRYKIALERKKVTDCVTPKAGKFIYTYENGKVRVRRRYPRQSEAQLGDTVHPDFLYEGPLV
jgi:hypothetical protein